MRAGRQYLSLDHYDNLTTNLGRPEVPIASALLREVATPCGDLADVSVSGPRIPWQSAFCSHFLLQLRRFAHDRKRQIQGTILGADFNRLGLDSSDSQGVDKNRGDSEERRV